MRVGIVGAGAIAMGMTAFLMREGHNVAIWSPSGAGTAFLLAGKTLTASGAVEGQFNPAACATASELAENDILIVALPSYGYAAVLDALGPFIRKEHTIIISAHLSLAALHLSRLLYKRGIAVPIVAWNTSVLTAKAPTRSEVRIGTIRASVDMCVLPVRFAARATWTCGELFGDRFRLQDDLLTIVLSNVNPQIHLGIALCNLTRIESGEPWKQNSNVTSSVGRLLEALDVERLAIASAYGKSVRTIEDHFEFSFGLKGQSVAAMSQVLVRRGNDPFGPTTIDTRYILEDVPFV